MWCKGAHTNLLFHPRTHGGARIGLASTRTFPLFNTENATTHGRYCRYAVPCSEMSSAGEQEHSEEILTSSATALRSLTISSETADRSVRDATAALTELLTKVTASRIAREELAKSERRYKARNERALAELARVDQEIVQAKVGAVELFEERDTIKREMNRSKLILEEIKSYDENKSKTGKDSEEKVEKDKTKELSLDKQEKECKGIEKEIASTMQALGPIENGLLVTTDQLDTLRKRKEKLKGKLSEANGEW